VFAKEVWLQFAIYSEGRIRVPELGVEQQQWWNSSLAGLSRRDQRWMDVFLLTVKIRQPSHEFTFGVGISLIPYPLVLTPVV
jgi:hypothetical protein